MQFKRNNLTNSSSPYLLQHTDNPVWWQEWSRDVIRHAALEKKPLFVSVGYSTCHWCHVMASEAFSDRDTADYLNTHYVCIKIDREQRPDIDQFLMGFINRQNGSGGWPLNVFLTEDLRPVYALTYAPAKHPDPSFSFLSVARSVFEFIEQKKETISQFNPEKYDPPFSNQENLVEAIIGYFDQDNGGFGNRQKFPSHTTLLYLLYFLASEENDTVRNICIKTLDAMRLRGLNDHLQGGIFRYCVDPEWTVPHFEKMLYDQAMALWVYALGFRLTGDFVYKSMAEKITTCLEDSFKEGEFYISAHDADTGHEEGATYLWSYNELEEILTTEEFNRLSGTYIIGKDGNFEGRIHLIRRNDNSIKEIEDKLLSFRNGRKQPSRDGKIISGINALTAISLIQAGRYLDNSDLVTKADSLVHNIIQKFWNGKTLGHSFFKGSLQEQSFLSDAGALLTAVTMLYEHDRSWEGMMSIMGRYVNSFKEGDDWIESKADDFPSIGSSWFDHPVPSGMSLTWMGMTRAMLLSGGETTPMEYMQPLQADFYNVAAMISNGLFHVFTTKEFVPWNMLPANSLQKRGEPESNCFRGVCKNYSPPVIE
jgi:uncharacterized protein